MMETLIKALFGGIGALIFLYFAVHMTTYLYFRNKEQHYLKLNEIADAQERMNQRKLKQQMTQQSNQPTKH